MERVPCPARHTRLAGPLCPPAPGTEATAAGARGCRLPAAGGGGGLCSGPSALKQKPAVRRRDGHGVGAAGGRGTGVARAASRPRSAESPRPGLASWQRSRPAGSVPQPSPPQAPSPAALSRTPLGAACGGRALPPAPGVVPAGCCHPHAGAQRDAQRSVSRPDPSVAAAALGAPRHGPAHWGALAPGPPLRAVARGGGCGARVATSGGFPCGGVCCHGFAEPRRFHGGSAALPGPSRGARPPGMPGPRGALGGSRRHRRTPAPGRPSPCNPSCPPRAPPAPGQPEPFAACCVFFPSLRWMNN